MTLLIGVVRLLFEFWVIVVGGVVTLFHFDGPHKGYAHVGIAVLFGLLGTLWIVFLLGRLGSYRNAFDVLLLLLVLAIYSSLEYLPAAIW